MVRNTKTSNFRNAEHLQFMDENCTLLKQHDPANLEINDLYEDLVSLKNEEQAIMAIERGNALTESVSYMERYRDRLHGGLYCYVKSFLYDEEEAEQYDAARRIMRIIQQVGNPTKLSESAETSMLNTLEEQLKPYTADLELIGAMPRLNKLMAANRRYVELFAERRDNNLERPTGGMKNIRLKIDPVYKSIVSAINNFASRKAFAEKYAGIVKGMDKLAAEYNRLLNSRKARSKKSNK